MGERTIMLDQHTSSIATVATFFACAGIEAAR
jgi:hypothetical protein